MKLYPLKFQPLFKYRIWGGNQLKTELNKAYTEDSIGESWEISDVENDETQVASGALKGQTLKQLISEHKGAILGNKVYDNFGEEFPLLIKYIDAAKPLSIQVHPGDDVARERHNSFGKNEMWYIMEADENAEIIVGFNKNVDKEVYNNELKNGDVTSVMNHEKVAKGNAFYIPAGRIHAIGTGILLAEIQQTSNVTYRIHDYNRVDAKTGETRELHTELAEAVIDFDYHESYGTDYDTKKNTSNELIHSPYFKSNILPVSGTITKDYSQLDSFVIFMCVKGDTKITYNATNYVLSYGETILIPACINNITIQGDNEQLLEVYL